MNDIIQYGVAESGVVPVRRTPSETSEMVTQLFLGETVGIIAYEGVWARVIPDFDRYEGWVGTGQIKVLSESDYHSWMNHPQRKRSPFRCRMARCSVHNYLQVPAGAWIPMTEDALEWFGDEFSFQSDPIRIVTDNVIETAMGFLGVPYLWGGRTENGIDCSGFIQTIHMLHGITLPRDSRDQYDFGDHKGVHLEEASHGDIIFFKHPDRQVNHIGFYLGDGLLLHASGQVRIDRIDPDYASDATYRFNRLLSEGIVGIIRPFSDT